ncbi:MAG: hypothetical protein LQ346_004744 [Caloplaca aetnensis]|nr:MAG: hypothetical protein LQ346_004744 [Caloplaca aetnensis]
MALLFLRSLTLLLLNISLALSATPPPPDTQISRVRLPINTPGVGLASPPIEVHTTNHTLSDGRAIACFRQRPKHEERLWWIREMDCYSSMARGLLLGDDVMQPKDWTEPGRPYSWNSGTCMIILDQKDADAAPGIQEAEVAHVAAVITRICVTKKALGEPLGGQTLVGIRDAYTLTVWGRDWGGA